MAEKTQRDFDSGMGLSNVRSAVTTLKQSRDVDHFMVCAD